MKNTIKITKNTSIFYCEKRQIIIFKGSLTKRSIKLKVKLLIKESDQTITVTQTTFNSLSNQEKKKIKTLQGTTVAMLKQALIETSTILYQKLKFVGVGYRAFPVENLEKNLISFKLGNSHTVYFKIPAKIDITCQKLTKLFIFGNSYHQVTHTAALIRSYKRPEPYKGKGILYAHEKVKLKEGKKT